MLGMTFDSADFLNTSYVVEEDQIPHVLGLQSMPNSGRMRTRSSGVALPRGRRGKRPVMDEEDEEDDKDDEEEEEDNDDQNV